MPNTEPKPKYSNWRDNVKVKTLIEILCTFDPEIDVLVEGYEGGLSPVATSFIRRVKYTKDENKDWYFGPHEELEGLNGKSIGGEEGILIERQCADKYEEE